MVLKRRQAKQADRLELNRNLTMIVVQHWAESLPTVDHTAAAARYIGASLGSIQEDRATGTFPARLTRRNELPELRNLALYYLGRADQLLMNEPAGVPILDSELHAQLPTQVMYLVAAEFGLGPPDIDNLVLDSPSGRQAAAEMAVQETFISAGLAQYAFCVQHFHIPSADTWRNSGVSREDLALLLGRIVKLCLIEGRNALTSQGRGIWEGLRPEDQTLSRKAIAEPIADPYGLSWDDLNTALQVEEPGAYERILRELR